MQPLNKDKCTGWYIFIGFGPIQIGVLFILLCKFVEIRVIKFSDIYNEININEYIYYLENLSTTLYILILLPIFVFGLIWLYLDFIKTKKHPNYSIRICRIMTVAAVFLNLPFYYFLYAIFDLFVDREFMKEMLGNEKISSIYSFSSFYALVIFIYPLSIGASLVGGLIGYLWSRRVDQ